MMGFLEKEVTLLLWNDYRISLSRVIILVFLLLKYGVRLWCFVLH